MLPTEKEALFKEVRRARAFYRKEATAEDLAIWWDCLKDEYLSDIVRALDSHMKYSRYVPMPADVIKRIHGEDKNGDGGGHGDRQCSFTHNGKRCPALWSISVAGNNYCTGHYEIRGKEKPSVDLLFQYLDNGIPFKPDWHDEIGARLLLKRTDENEVMAVYGKRTLAYIKAVPEREAPEPAPTEAPHLDQSKKAGSFLERVKLKRATEIS